jgi:hypothetical protein
MASISIPGSPDCWSVPVAAGAAKLEGDRADQTGHRPDIRKSNIVCAEPMPGEKELLAAFSESLKPRVLGQLVEIIFEKMALAGEAGSLLKIEEEIEDAVEKAREAFNRELLRRKDEAGYLPGMAPKIQQRELFDFADLPDKTQFWQTAEDKILEALKTYAEQAEAEEGNIRRLFTEDAAKGFAFIDLCRKRYDVVLMNPPFGALAKKSKTFTSKKYPSTWNDIYGCFIERMIEILVIGGRLGGITSSTFFNLVSFKPLRELLLHSTLPDHFVDLGSGVMDDAAVNAAISIVGKQNSSNKKPILFLDFRKSSQNEEKLQATIKLLTFGKSNSTIHNKYISFFTGLPNLILAYWLTDRIHRIFLDCGPLGAKCKNSFGLHARGNDDLVFRAWWEPSQDERFSINWPTVKLGGNPNRFVRNSDYVVNWKNNGQLLKQIAKKAQGGCLTGISLYFRKGLTYIYTGNTFSVQPLEENSIFSAAAHGLFGSLENYLILLAFLNSEPCRLLLKTINPDRFFQSGYVGLLPVPQFSNNQIIALEDVAKTFLKAKRSFLTGDECCRLFSVEWSSRYPHGTNGKLLENVKNLSKDTLNLLNREFDRLNFEVFEAYGVDAEDFDPIKERTVKPSLLSIGSDLGSVETNQTSYTSAVLSYGFGVIFGRWDIRFASGDKSPPPLPAPFESLPVCPSGMLQNTDGLPAEPKDVPADYPLRISWSGIILDDEGHTEDIITRIRETMEVIWKDNANDIEQEACEILGVRSLREYFSKPAKFFADHLKRYSKSRRQAPIYWPLSTPSGSYTLWLYYHRLTDQILYTCVNNFVGPKLKQVSEDAASLRKTSNRTKKQETELENLSVLALELTEFQDELLRIAKFWKPNLNDGVQITAAPLWKLFQYKPWQKKLKKTWKELEKGKYDWAHLAYSIWPERVIRASHKDRSFAIAHDLEKDLWEEIETGTDRQGHVKTKWVPKQLSENELKAIIQEKIRMHHHVD